MGIVGRYIDALSDKQRDRVIEAQGWCWQFSNLAGCHCLVGHAEAYVGHAATDSAHDEAGELLRISYDQNGWLVYDKVPELFDRFGQDRIVRLCKARAAKGNAPDERVVFLYGSTLLTTGAPKP